MALTKENNLNNDKLISNDQFKVDVPFDYLFKEFEGTLTDALNLLNMEAEEQGFKFKIKTFSNKESSKSSYAYLYCKERFRYTPPSSTKEKKKVNKKAANGSKSKQANERYMAYFGFKLKTIKNKVKIYMFHSENPTHNHKSNQEITSCYDQSNDAFSQEKANF